MQADTHRHTHNQNQSDLEKCTCSLLNIYTDICSCACLQCGIIMDHLGFLELKLNAVFVKNSKSLSFVNTSDILGSEYWGEHFFIYGIPNALGFLARVNKVCHKERGKNKIREIKHQ